MEMQRKARAGFGFTMVELMAVLVVLGLLSSVAALKFLGKVDDAKITTTRASLRLLHTAVDQYYMDTGRWPPSGPDALRVLIEQPSNVSGWQTGGYLYTEELPTDAWGHPFIYERQHGSRNPFIIKSLGADGQEGGEDHEADLYSTDA